MKFDPTLFQWKVRLLPSIFKAEVKSLGIIIGSISKKKSKTMGSIIFNRKSGSIGKYFQ